MRHATVAPTSREESQGNNALRAWGLLHPNGSCPAWVETVMEQQKASLYRLYGAGPEGACVIAKRIPCHATAERIVYESVLWQLPVTAPRCFGSVDDGPAYWLFIEDVGSTRCRVSRPEHLTAATRWLASAHASAARLAPPADLPDAGPARYLAHLRSAKANIEVNLRRAELCEPDVSGLGELLADCELVEQRWSELERACAATPATLVHGDYLPKNVRIRDQADGSAILPIDWETAGWGCPAADLAHVDVDLYAAAVAPHWAGVTPTNLRLLASIGRAFRWIAAIDWESEAKSFEHTERALMRLAVYRAGLAEAMQSVLPGCRVGLGAFVPLREKAHDDDDDVEVVRRIIAPQLPLVRTLRNEAELKRGSYRTRALAAELGDGSVARLFVKQFDANRYGKGAPQERWRREVDLYGKLLPHGELGVARYYGASADAETQRLWLVLEFVAAPLLKRLPSEQWEPVARWLARLHTHVARRADWLAALPFLERHDAAFFWDAARRAVHKLRQHDDLLAARVQRVLDRYEVCVRMMTRDTPTLVHGSFRAGDILIDPAAARVCPADWERAAVGCRYFDLAYLTDLLAESQRRSLLRCYVEEADAAGQPLEADDAQRCFDACCLHRTLVRLRKWSRQRHVTPFRLVEQAEHLVARCAEQ